MTITKTLKACFNKIATRRIYDSFPEIILVDATYKLLELRLPVYLLVTIDGNGLSEVVALFLLVDESKPVVQSAVEI